MKVYTINGIDMIHITEFAELTQRSVQSTRYLIEKGNAIRKLKFFRDRSRLMIPLTELKGFPLSEPGHASAGKIISHYKLDENGIYVKEVCNTCTYSSSFCEDRKQAEELEVPLGDL